MKVEIIGHINVEKQNNFLARSICSLDFLDADVLL